MNSEFFLPILRKRFLVRLLVVALTAFIWFRFITVPAWVQGASMAPTYADGSLLFYLPWKAQMRSPEVGDVVAVRMAGRRVMLLKRVVALEGDVVEFRNGWLFVNGAIREEPYVVYREPWQMPPRPVLPDHVYIVGDNRGMAMEQHDFGQTEKERIIGYPFPRK